MAGTEGPILETEGIERTFGRFLAVDDVSISVDPGEFRGVIGPNGAGKTTLFNLISGALKPTDGRIAFKGEDITRLSPEQRVHRGMGRSFQILNIFDGLSVRENIRVAVQSAARHRSEYSLVEAFTKTVDRHDEINERTDEILAQIGLTEDTDIEARALAYGQRRRLEIGMVLATDPDLVMFDEPTAGMGIEQKRATIDLIGDVLNEQTLLLIEHDIELVMELSDRLTVLHMGEVLAEGSPEEIADNQDVQDAYLGGMTR